MGGHAPRAREDSVRRGADPASVAGRSTSPLEGSMALAARFRVVARLWRSLSVLTLCLAPSVTLGNAISEGCPDSGVRIYLDAAGVITVNGHVVPPADLPQALASLKPQPTEVCYSRANAQREPPPGAMAVMEAIIALRLPVGFYTDGTFKTRVKLK